MPNPLLSLLQQSEQQSGPDISSALSASKAMTDKAIENIQAKYALAERNQRLMEQMLAQKQAMEAQTMPWQSIGSQNLPQDVQNVYRRCEGVNPKLKAFYEALVPVSQKQLGYSPTVGETLRSQARQRYLYSLGPSVTRTLKSRHLKGLAMDLALPKGANVDAFIKLAYPIAAKYGVGHIGRWDPLHFQL